MSGFDAIAKDYDRHFTNTIVGRDQRNRVWNYMDTIWAQHWKNVLELNGGTGEDAMHFVQHANHYVLSDSSDKMLEQARHKLSHNTHFDRFEFLKINMENIKEHAVLDQYDLIFSNFGGLNCLSPDDLAAFAECLISNAKTNLDLVLVVMPKDCKLDKYYNLLKLNFDRVGNRKRGRSMVQLGDEKIECFYYNPKELMSYFPSFQLIAQVSVGFIPSYFTYRIRHGGIIGSYLMNLNREWLQSGKAPKYSDHYLLHLRKEA